MEQADADTYSLVTFRGEVGFCVLCPDPTSRAPPLLAFCPPGVVTRRMISDMGGGRCIR